MVLNKLKNKSVNINMDSDGILSYLLLKKYKLCSNIGGLNNSSELILSEKNVIDEIWEDAFIDIFSPIKNVLTIDQHIISSGQEKFEDCKINPHILIEEHFAFSDTYFSKYPFSTFLFILSILERENKIEFDFDVFENILNIGDDINLCDMMLRADGVLYNAVKYKSNVNNWGKKLIEFSKGGQNTKKIIDYINNMDDDKSMKKYNTISLFYQNYGLTKDGGYNKEKKLETNLKLISNLLKSFSNYMNIDVHKSKKEFCIYNGKSLVTDKIDEINIDKIDTYAFVKKNLLSYTENIIKTENNIKIEIFE